ncbi:uncharacterized protein DSM5745_05931 [Aspergillus mulundensis]|uniref:Nephrocystin 3-like N-terminal domain-containing protein n=1 Tax=Aspergillus mulundensis TaxID=1810919 RepID=A0A3D8RYE8_9EURO|nr:hypothetical protein DSM5745_05931 [Aspergillus mulundensis]RDW79079.1 hypothetical protein DSM5745_05931 [Aspergillus mulundensis]
MGYNPKPTLQTSINLWHQNTGLWLTEGDEFKDWLGSRNGKPWLSGIPGAGKTVLAGLMIQECLAATQYVGSNKGCCFFFCDYKELESLEEVNILSCLASQLARQSHDAFGIMAAYYKDLNPGNSLPRSPEAAVLIEKLVEMTQCFDQVLLVVDGLQSKVTEYLASPICKAPSTSVALLSRVEEHIRVLLDGTFHHIEIAAQSADVDMYVRAELKQRIQEQKLRIRRPSLEGEIIEALIQGGQGMFLWVSCQMDYLCDFCKEALGKLPPTLNATYERILRNVVPASSHIMQMTLRMVAAAGREISIPQLSDALALR